MVVPTAVAVNVRDGPVVEKAHLLFVRERVYTRRVTGHSWESEARDGVVEME